MIGIWLYRLVTYRLRGKSQFVPLQSGHISTQNIRQYAPTKSSPLNGGRLGHFMDCKQTFLQR